MIELTKQQATMVSGAEYLIHMTDKCKTMNLIDCAGVALIVWGSAAFYMSGGIVAAPVIIAGAVTTAVCLSAAYAYPISDSWYLVTVTSYGKGPVYHYEEII